MGYSGIPPLPPLELELFCRDALDIVSVESLEVAVLLLELPAFADDVVVSGPPDEDIVLLENDRDVVIPDAVTIVAVEVEVDLDDESVEEVDVEVDVVLAVV